MDARDKMKWMLEGIWWIVTAILIVIIMFPVWGKVDYPFKFFNVVSIVAFVTLTRHIFLLKYSLIAQQNTLKVVLLILCLPLAWFLIENMSNFQTFLDYLDDTGWDTVFGEKPHEKQLEMYKYLRTEVSFFGTASLILCVLFPIRMVISVWRQRNRGTV